MSRITKAVVNKTLAFIALNQLMEAIGLVADFTFHESWYSVERNIDPCISFRGVSYRV